MSTRRHLLSMGALALPIAALATHAAAQPWWNAQERHREYEQWREAEWRRRQAERHEWRREHWREEREREAWEARRRAEAQREWDRRR